MRSSGKIIDERTVRMVVFVLLTFSLCSAFLPPVCAAKLALVPNQLKIENAMRGGEYERIVTVITDENARVFLRTEGVAGGWISVYEFENQTAPVEEVIADENGRSVLLIRIKIPSDASNGTYTASLIAEVILSGAENSGGTGVGLRASVGITLEVTGTQILSGAVEYIMVEDTEVGYPLRIGVRFRNTGNVVATPEIRTTITKDGSPLDNFVRAEVGVAPEKTETITVEWDTTGRETGRYEASVEVMLGGEVLAAENQEFELLPFGTLSRRGELVELEYDGEPSVGSKIRILATFLNTGEIDTRARLVGEVHVDGVFTDNLSSDERWVEPGEKVTLRAYLGIEKTGRYVVEGWVEYDGKVTEVKELSFKVGSEPGSVLPVVVMVFAALLVGGGLVGGKTLFRKFSPKAK